MSISDGISDNGETIKSQIITALEALLRGMQDGGENVWRRVDRGDLEDVDNDQCPIVTIDFGEEEMLNNTFPCSTYSMPVFFTFRFRGQRGLDEHTAYMYYLGLLQLAVLREHNIDGSTLSSLTQDVKEVSNAHTIVGIDDVYPGGTLIVDVIYKTRLHNPYAKP